MIFKSQDHQKVIERQKQVTLNNNWETGEWDSMKEREKRILWKKESKLSKSLLDY
jgi:hypothetical protein